MTNNRTAKLPIQVLVVDDHPVVRAGLTSLLGKEHELSVIGSAYSAEEALSLISRSRVDVLLLDLHMPGTSGIDLLKILQRNLDPPVVVLLSSYEYEEEIYQAVKAGAKGYLSKGASSSQIKEAILAVIGGDEYFPPRIAEAIAERESQRALSDREIEVLELVSNGLTNKEISKILSISQFTVRNHINHICLKLHASDRTEAATVALRHGVIKET